jgi:hypothetical protein
MLKTKLSKRVILELSPIITMNGFQAVGMLIIQPQCQAPKVLKHFILAFQEENPRVTRIVVNDDKMSYPVFMPKPSTHHMHDPGSLVPHIRPKVLIDNQMS